MLDVLLHFEAPPYLQQTIDRLDDHALRITVCPTGDDGAFSVALRETDVLWHVLEPVRSTHIEKAPRLRLIQKIGVGVNTIDLAAARQNNIAVSNMPGTNSRAVAEMTLALMLDCLRQTVRLDSLTRTGAGWPLDQTLQNSFGELAGRTVGFVGYGAIPCILAPILRAMGASILYWSRSQKDDAAATWIDLEGLLAAADIVSLHVPLTDDTANLMDASRIAAMKPGAVLINTARGELVDETALDAALADGHLRAAGLDVHASEPVSPVSPLLRRENVVLTPHVAWLTPETWERSLAIAVENCRRLIAGEPLLHQVQ